MAIPTMGSSKLNLYSNPQDLAGKSSSGSASAASSSSTPQGSFGGNNFGFYGTIAQMGFNSLFGAITKPKAANLEAAQIMANTRLGEQAAKINAQELRNYEKRLKETALFSYVSELDSVKEFIGTQKAELSAAGDWGGSTFDAFVDDTVNKTVQDIAYRSKEVSHESENIRFQADMLELQAALQAKIGKANAQAVKDQGRTGALMSIFGLG